MTDGASANKGTAVDPLAMMTRESYKAWAGLLRSYTNDKDAGPSVPANFAAFFRQVMVPPRLTGEDLAQYFGFPTLADVMQPSDSLQRVVKVAAASDEAMQEYIRMANAIGPKIVEHFRAELAKTATTADNDKGIAASGLAECWSKAVDRALMETNRSEDYLALQRTALRAGLLARTEQVRIAESLAGFWGMPTRQEIDNVHRRVHELRREVAHLKRDLADVRKAAAPSPAKAATRKTPTPKRSTRTAKAPSHKTKES